MESGSAPSCPPLLVRQHPMQFKIRTDMLQANNSDLEEDRPGAASGADLATENCAVVNVAEEINRIHQSDEWKKDMDRITRMVVKHSGLRVAMVAMKAGAQWNEHKTPSRISVQPVEGRIRFRTADRDLTLGTGALLVLDSNVPHSVEALEDATFLLTLS
jgi:quercetin dioxygenase-like cupin family protein